MDFDFTNRHGEITTVFSLITCLGQNVISQRVILGFLTGYKLVPFFSFEKGKASVAIYRKPFFSSKSTCTALCENGEDRPMCTTPVSAKSLKERIAGRGYRMLLYSTKCFVIESNAVKNLSAVTACLDVLQPVVLDHLAPAQGAEPLLGWRRPVWISDPTIPIILLVEPMVQYHLVSTQAKPVEFLQSNESLPGSGEPVVAKYARYRHNISTQYAR